MLPKGIDTKDGLLTFSAIHQRFSATKHGKTLLPQSRYGTYKPDYIPDEVWQQYLGPDSNNLHHIYVTYLLTRDYVIAHPALSQDEKRLLLLAAITHDWGEAVTGDILVPFKTADHTAKEKQILKELIKEYLGDHLTPEIIELIPNIVFDRKTGLGKHFQAIEEWGYVRTSLKAWKHSQVTEDKTLQKQFYILVYSVFAYDLLNLIYAASDNRAIHLHLTTKAHITITQACDTMPQDMHKHHIHPDQTEWARGAFEKAKGEWKKIYFNA